MIDDRFVTKVHPLDRLVEPEDPLELMAQSVVGDPEVMLECMLQEFMWMGWGREELLSLFHHPGYPVLCQLREYFGDAEVERRVATLLAMSGRWRFRETIAADEVESREPELLQITLEASHT